MDVKYEPKFEPGPALDPHPKRTRAGKRRRQRVQTGVNGGNSRHGRQRRAETSAGNADCAVDGGVSASTRQALYHCTALMLQLQDAHAALAGSIAHQPPRCPDQHQQHQQSHPWNEQHHHDVEQPHYQPDHQRPQQQFHERPHARRQEPQHHDTCKYLQETRHQHAGSVFFAHKHTQTDPTTTADHERRQLSEREARMASRERLLIGREAGLDKREMMLATRERALWMAGRRSMQDSRPGGVTETHADASDGAQSRAESLWPHRPSQLHAGTDLLAPAAGSEGVLPVDAEEIPRVATAAAPTPPGHSAPDLAPPSSRPHPTTATAAGSDLSQNSHQRPPLAPQESFLSQDRPWDTVFAHCNGRVALPAWPVEMMGEAHDDVKPILGLDGQGQSEQPYLQAPGTATESLHAGTRSETEGRSGPTSWESCQAAGPEPGRVQAAAAHRGDTTDELRRDQGGSQNGPEADSMSGLAGCSRRRWTVNTTRRPERAEKSAVMQQGRGLSQRAWRCKCDWLNQDRAINVCARSGCSMTRHDNAHAPPTDAVAAILAAAAGAADQNSSLASMTAIKKGLGAPARAASKYRGRTVLARTSQATAALKANAPKLLETLVDHGILAENEGLEQLELFSASDMQGHGYEALQAVMRQISMPPGNTSSRASADNSLVACTSTTGDEVHRRYCVESLAGLVEYAKLSQLRSGTRVRWGWCPSLHAFLFVFDQHNRLVLESPQYGHATYFFEMEEPMLIECQIERLMAVLSVPGLTRTMLLEDHTFEMASLNPEDLRVLAQYGLKVGCGLASLINFRAQESVRHDYKENAVAEHWKENISKRLEEGRKCGRVRKVPCEKV